MNVSMKAPAASPKVTRRNACDAGIPIQCMQNESIGPPAVAGAACLEGLFMPANGLLLVLIVRLPGNIVFFAKTSFS